MWVVSVVVATALAFGATLANWYLWTPGPPVPASEFFSGRTVAQIAVPLAWPPGDLRGFLWTPAWRRPDKWIVSPVFRAGLLAGVLMPLSFVLLPVTLRRARVRGVHLVRMWAYSWIGLIPVLVGLALVGSLVQEFHWRVRFGYGLVIWWQRIEPVVELGVMLLWLLAWWGAGAGRYLRLPRPVLVAGAMAAISGLVAMLVVLAWMGPALVDDLGIG